MITATEQDRRTKTDYHTTISKAKRAIRARFPNVIATIYQTQWQSGTCLFLIIDPFAGRLFVRVTVDGQVIPE